MDTITSKEVIYIKRQFYKTYNSRRSIMAKYYKLRYTFNNDIQELDDKKEVINRLNDFKHNELPEWIAKLEMIDYLYGIEELDKFGDATKIHIHIHFTSDKDCGTIRKWLTRRWKEQGDDRTRAALYSLKQEEDVKENDRFFRYVLKQKSQPYKNFMGCGLIKDLTLEKLNEMRLLAHEEWNTLVEVNRKKREKELKKDSTYDKICKYLEDKKISGQYDIATHILDFYMEEGMSINTNTIAGYVLTYGMINGYIDKAIALNRISNIIDK